MYKWETHGLKKLNKFSQGLILSKPWLKFREISPKSITTSLNVDLSTSTSQALIPVVSTLL